MGSYCEGSVNLCNTQGKSFSPEQQAYTCYNCPASFIINVGKLSLFLSYIQQSFSHTRITVSSFLHALVHSTQYFALNFRKVWQTLLCV